MNRFGYARPRTLDGVLEIMRPNARPKAGGIDLLDLMKEGLEQPKKLIDIRQVQEFQGIRSERDRLCIGAVTTLRELAENMEVRLFAQALSQAAASSATPNVRNVATLGGNLLQRPRCWYFRSKDFRCRKKGGRVCYARHGESQYHGVFDNDVCAMVHPSSLATALVALDATVIVQGRSGRRPIAIDDFFVGPDVDLDRETILGDDEVVVEVHVPKSASKRASVSFYAKIGERRSYDWPLAAVAVALQVDAARADASRSEKTWMNTGTVVSARMVLGAAAPYPYRSRLAERVLVGHRLTPQRLASAARSSLQGATPLAKNAYKLELFSTLVEDTLRRACGIDMAGSVQ